MAERLTVFNRFLTPSQFWISKSIAAHHIEFAFALAIFLSLTEHVKNMEHAMRAFICVESHAFELCEVFPKNPFPIQLSLNTNEAMKTPIFNLKGLFFLFSFFFWKTIMKCT